MTMKRFYFFVMMLCSSVSLFAQATDLVVDNQTPGWLSSKINYGDQMTVKNLKVTGYVNETDIEFLGTLINYNLRSIDMYDANAVNNSLAPEKNLFGDISGELSCLKLPNSLENAKNLFGNSKVTIDTLYFNIPDLTQLSLGSGNLSIHHIIFGDKVKIIPMVFQNCDKIESFTFHPNTLSIAETAFWYCTSLSKTNIGELKKLYSLGENAFIGCYNYPSDTLVIPNSLIELNLKSFRFKPKQHIFISSSTLKLNNNFELNYNNAYYISKNVDNLYLHMESKTPPLFSSTLPSSYTVYVPKGAKPAYMNDKHWNKATIIEVENPLKNIELSEQIKIMENKEKYQFSVSFTPADADDKSVVWSIEDPAIATVNEEGLVTALSPGKTKVTVTSVPTGIQASCEIVVLQHVTGVSMSVPSLEMTKIGETYQLDVTVAPENATDKSVKWTSSNPSVCTVTESGNVIALGYGTAIVIATTTDGSFPAACVVNVIQPVTIKAKNATRTYGEANPTFEYSSEGAELVGTPVITCEATETSPVGEYPIVVTKGSVTNSNDSYVNGTLTITKAPLKVSVGNYSRTKGEDNPEFTIDYDWFKNGDDVSVLLTKPTAYTTATKDSEAGEYPIYISGGEAQNYELFYTDGVLTVIASTGIDSVVSSESKVFDVYSIGGTKVRSKISTLDNLPKGVYIVNGKKLVVQ